MLAAVLMLTACGEPVYTTPAASPTSSSEAPAGTTYQGTGTVLQAKGKDPQLCLGGVMDSLPPKCGGLPLQGWDWDAVEDEESANGTTWGSYSVTGDYDGKVFKVLEARAPDWSGGTDHPIETPCDEPAGGWEQPEPDKVAEEDRIRVMRRVRRQPDFSGIWIDYLEEPAEFEDTPYVLNVAFAGDVEGHEAEIREDWGGPLCVVEFEHPLDGLLAIQEELSREAAKEMGLEVLTSGVSENRNVLQISVVVATAEMLDELEERYGPGTVEVDARLRPVE